MRRHLKTVNTILYCARWEETVEFYRTLLRLPVTFSTRWFVEFALTDTARLSIADQRHASVKTGGGQGITIAMAVDDIQEMRAFVKGVGLEPTAIKSHAWSARVFYLFDPEGHRLEFWQSTTGHEN